MGKLLRHLPITLLSSSLLWKTSFAQDTSSLPSCSDTSSSEYDYIVVGAGAGGGPVAARLALNGYKVLVIEAGKDYVTYNTTVPAYLARVTEDPEIVLDYYVDQNDPADTANQVRNWYPRSQGIGGSTIHNALINLVPHSQDFNKIQSMFSDNSWSYSNMMKYFTRIERNTYVPSLIGTPLGHGYDGWLSTDGPPLNLLTDLSTFDLQLVGLAAAVTTAVAPVALADWNTPINDGAEGGGAVILTKDSNHQRSSVRDHLIATQKLYPTNLVFRTESIATKVLTCKNTDGSVSAYGVEYAQGAYLLPVSPRFTGKQATLATKTVTAKYEVIISAGTFQTPQLLMLSGIGDPTHLTENGVTPIVSLPGVGQNVQDRLEMTIVWRLNNDLVVLENCKFGDDPATDPCLKKWIEDGRTNVYSSGPGIWAHASRSASKSSSDPLDIWSMWGPGNFTGYRHGWSLATAQTSVHSWNNVILKAHTASKGTIKLTGSHIQDPVAVSKNQFTTAESKQDLIDVREAIKKSRNLAKNKLGLWNNIKEEVWPGPSVSTDAQLDEFIKKNTWGHHLCCSAKIGADNDKTAVLDQNFKVRGVNRLRVVDNSVWPEIPGMFVTTPIYMISEKAADAILATASANGWTPSGTK